MKLHSIASILAISASIVLLLCSIPSSYATITSTSGDVIREIGDPSTNLDSSRDRAAGGSSNHARNERDSLGHQRGARDNVGKGDVSPPTRTASSNYLRKSEHQDPIVTSKDDSKAIAPFIPTDNGDVHVISDHDNRRALTVAVCYNIHFTTHRMKHSSSNGPFEIKGHRTIPSSCYKGDAASCDIEVCSTDDKLVIVAKTSDAWIFTISGDIGPLVDRKTVPNGKHHTPFPTKMDTDEFDSMQTYELRKCYDLYIKTLDYKYADSSGPFEITDYGKIPSSCLHRQKECHIRVCPSRQNSEKLIITAKTANAWYFKISGDIGPLVSFTTAPGGKHRTSYNAMDTDQFDSVLTYKLENKGESGQWTTLTRDKGAPKRKTAYFSEEGKGKAYYTGGIVGGIRCKGKNCDDKRLLTYQYKGHSPLFGTTKYTGWFSEENAEKLCPENMVVMSMGCKGRFCDSLRLKCSFLAFGYRLVTSGVRKGGSNSKKGNGYCTDGYYLIGVRCRQDFCRRVDFFCARVEFNASILDQITPPSDMVLAKRFAPVMYFDQKASQFPEALSDWWKISKYDEDEDRRYLPDYTPKSKFSIKTLALSYSVHVCEDGRTKIVYYSFYKGQQTCALGKGGHEGDFERLVVELTSDFKDIYRVRYHQHGGFYSRAKGKFQTDRSDSGVHPRSFVGKNSNGQYHDDGGSGGCAYFEDYRNVKKSGNKFESWKEGRLDFADEKDDWNNFTGKFGRIHNPVAKDSEPDNICSNDQCKGKGSGYSKEAAGCKKNSV